MMSFEPLLAMLPWPRYKRFAVLGQSGSDPLWDYNKWLQVAAVLDRLFALVPGTPSVRAIQSVRNKDKGVRFRRVRWKRESFADWCHNSPKTKGISDGWRFNVTMIYCPGHKECGNKHKLPVIFVDVRGKLEVEQNRSR